VMLRITWRLNIFGCTIRARVYSKADWQ